MDNVDNSYCRLCAEPKGTEKLLDLQCDSKIQNEVMVKLTFLNALYVNVTDHDSLPKTICFICYESLNKAYDFLEGVKRAQDILTNLFTASDLAKNEASDDEFFDDILTSESIGCSPDIKTEDSTLGDTKLLNEFEFKKEPKEDKDLESLQSLNVHDFLDATMPLALYAKQVRKENKDTHVLKEDIEIEKEDEDAGVIINNWSEYPWVCGFCSIEFISMDMLRSHVKLVHGKCCAHFCFDCKMAKKDDFSAFVKHIRKHRKYLRNFCYYCFDEVENLAELKVHIKQHCIKPQTACPLCGEIHKNEDSLALHLQDYGSDKPKRRPRRKPNTPYTIEELTCDLCKKVYKNPNSLRDHRKLHTINRKRDYTCDRCGKTFYNKGTLTSHISLSHDKIRPHVCRICNRSFLFPNMLRRHVEMHSGVKPFSCEQCGRGFRLQYQLNAHKIVHTDSMPYVCSYCNKAFRFKQILKNHERQHTGAKPYSCQNCGMEFTNWSNYNKHMKRRHNTDTSKKKITPEGVFPINPETGQIIQVDLAETAEWKSKIMIPGKRGKKKIIKEEEVV